MNKIILIIVAFLALLLVSMNGAPKAFAHTSDYMYGFKVGQEDKSSGIYDPGDACQNALAYGKIINSGYHDGFYGIGH
jgi:hypothetical protein